MNKVLRLFDQLFNRIYTTRFNPFYQSGRLAVLSLMIVTATGVYLLCFYKIAVPYESVASLHEQWWAGRWIRTLHRYASDMVIIFTAVHAFRMFVEKKADGVRVLAWVTGIFLVLLVLFCGWTGFVLVWDLQGQLLAQVGARLADALPIFSEPIQRSFLSDNRLPSSFFFLNLFLHVAIPLGILFLIIIHVWRLSTAHFFPTKGATIGCTLTLVVFSILLPVPLRSQADLSTILGRVHIDFFYNFWLPLAAIMQPRWHLLLWLIIVLFLMSIPWWWHTKSGDNEVHYRWN